jgi:hypothetical protein
MHQIDVFVVGFRTFHLITSNQDYEKTVAAAPVSLAQNAAYPARRGLFQLACPRHMTIQTGFLGAAAASQIINRE